MHQWRYIHITLANVSLDVVIANVSLVTPDTDLAVQMQSRELVYRVVLK